MRKHAWRHRLQWHPAIVALPAAYVAWRIGTAGWTFVRVLMAVTAGAWLTLAVYNSIARDRLLDWLYDSDD